MRLRRSRQPLVTSRVYERERWSGVLDSSEPGVDWQVEWTVVWWVEDTASTQLASAAVVAIRERAAAVARTVGVKDDTIRHALAAELGQPRLASGVQLWAAAEDVRAELTEYGAALVRRKQERVVEEVEIAHLRENVLSDLPHAVLWWLLRNDCNVEGALAKKDKLDELIALVHARKASDHWTVRLSSALDEAMPGLEVQNRWDVFDQIQRLMKDYGHDNAADELARSLG